MGIGPRNHLAKITIAIMILLVLLTASGCVKGGALATKSYGFSKGVTGAAAQPIPADKDGSRTDDSSRPEASQNDK